MTKTMTHVEELRHVASLDQCSWDYAQKLMRSSADQIERLRAALLDLYNGTAEYIYLNNLGDPHNTTPMRRASEVLGVAYPRSMRPAAEPDAVPRSTDEILERHAQRDRDFPIPPLKSGGGHSNLCACPACLQARGREAIDNAVKANEGQS